MPVLSGDFIVPSFVILTWSANSTFLRGIEGACPAILGNPGYSLLIGVGVEG